MPFVSFVGPLIIFVVFKDRSPWLREQALEALNFSILYAITQVVSATLILLSIGMVLWPLVIVAAVIFCVMGAVASSRGEPYRYPINLSIIR